MKLFLYQATNKRVIKIYSQLYYKEDQVLDN